MSTHATFPGHGTAGKLQWPKDTEATYAYKGIILPSAWTGKDFEAAPVPSMTQSTFAQDAGWPLISVAPAWLGHFQ